MSPAKSSSSSSALVLLPACTAETLGTFLLASGVSIGIAAGFPFVSLIAAFIVGLCVFTMGPISGAHFNPAVTVAFWSVGKTPTRTAIHYVIAQFIGAALALVAVPAYLGIEALPAIPDGSLPMTILAEAIGASILCFGIAAVVYGKAKDAATGFTVGGSLMLGIFVASGHSAGILNPAVALTLGAWTIPYAAGPLVGGLAGAWLYKTIAGER